MHKYVYDKMNLWDFLHVTVNCAKLESNFLFSVAFLVPTVETNFYRFLRIAKSVNDCQ